jgi:hypothetical protein
LINELGLSFDSQAMNPEIERNPMKTMGMYRN